MELFEKYHQDGMLGEDILTLIKLLARIPNNDSFKGAVLPQVFKVVTQFH